MSEISYDRCYLSPHLDDAVFSCGGQIHDATARGESVCIVSVFTGDEPCGDALSYDAKCLHLSWGLSRDIYATRRREDLLACQRLSATSIHLGFLDCIYRRDSITGNSLYDLQTAMGGEIRSADTDVLLRVVDAIRQLPPASTFVVPLGVASAHVDHLLVRYAAEAVFGHEVLYYYEDLPYACYFDVAPQLLEFQQWAPQFRELSSGDLEKKIIASEEYRSQLFDVFKGQKVKDVLIPYANRIGGERLWKKKVRDWYQVVSDVYAS